MAFVENTTIRSFHLASSTASDTKPMISQLQRVGGRDRQDIAHGDGVDRNRHQVDRNHEQPQPENPVKISPITTSTLSPERSDRNSIAPAASPPKRTPPARRASPAYRRRRRPARPNGTARPRSATSPSIRWADGMRRPPHQRRDPHRAGHVAIVERIQQHAHSRRSVVWVRSSVLHQRAFVVAQ